MTEAEHATIHCAGAHSACVTVPLPELYVDGFDADQIWEEFEVQVRKSKAAAFRQHSPPHCA